MKVMGVSTKCHYSICLLFSNTSHLSHFDPAKRQPVAAGMKLKKTWSKQMRMLSGVRIFTQLKKLLRLTAASATATIPIAALLSYWIAVAYTAARPPFPFLLVAVAEKLPLARLRPSTISKLSTPKTHISQKSRATER
jgi:hypothetical protein